jgi:hypothetical protein
VGPLLAPHIAALARELQIPDDVARMTPASNWRSSSASTTSCGGATRSCGAPSSSTTSAAASGPRSFSPPYQTVIKPGLAMHRGAGMLLVAMLAWAALARTRRRAPELDAAAPREPEPPPSPAAGAPAAA